MLEHLEHQSLGAADLAPDAKPARNKILWLVFLVVVFALLTAPVSRPDICSFLFFMVIVD
jgi:hypothetical protein